MKPCRMRLGLRTVFVVTMAATATSGPSSAGAQDRVEQSGELEAGDDADLRKAEEIGHAGGAEQDYGEGEGSSHGPLCLAHTPTDEELESVRREVEGGIRARARARRSHDGSAHLEGDSSFDDAVMVFPLVVHVLHSARVPGSRVSEDTIRQQVAVLNSAYGGATHGDSPDTMIRFKLKGRIRYTESHTYASACWTKSLAYRKAYTVADPTVINVFVCPANGYLGWAYLPWQHKEGSVYQAITINGQTMPGGSMRNLNLGDTLVHEMGHYLGLLHTFSSEGSCGRGDDGIADTPYERTPSYSCNVKDTCSQPGADPIYNFMDQSPDYCMDRFTEGQVVHMQKMVSHYRPKLAAASRSYADADGNFVTPCEGLLSGTYCAHGGVLHVSGTQCVCTGCAEGYYGDRCSRQMCTGGQTREASCNNRGTPTQEGENCVCRECAPGHAGLRCEVMPCMGKTADGFCNGNGAPRALDDSCTCSCAPAFAGPACEHSDAVTCGGRGQARDDGSCQCFGTYAGESCEVDPCVGKTTDNFCNGRGTVYEDGDTCACKNCVDEFSGRRCESTPCSGKTAAGHCNGQGFVEVSGSSCTCHCPPGYGGASCEHSPCAGKSSANFCSGHGDPEVQGSGCACKCAPGYHGAACEADDCAGKTTDSFCNRHGTPRFAGSECTCEGCTLGYGGARCELTPCTGLTRENLCNGVGEPGIRNGRCACTCHEGYTGYFCGADPCSGKTAESFCNGKGVPHVSGSQCKCRCHPFVQGTSCGESLTGGVCKARAECTNGGDCKKRCCKPTLKLEGCISCSAGGECIACEDGMFLQGRSDATCGKWMDACRVVPVVCHGFSLSLEFSLSLFAQVQACLLPTNCTDAFPCR